MCFSTAHAENPGVWNSLKGESMELIKFIMWLSAGAVIGWFASRIVSIERRRIVKPNPVIVSTIEEL